MRNNFFKVLGLVGLALFLACAAYADGTPVNMVFTGVNGVSDGQYYVSPYYGTMNGAPVTLFCDDINNEVTWGQTWTANVTSLASGVFTNTRYGNGSINPNLGGTNPQVLYEEAAWLVTQFASNSSDYVTLQHALWDLMTPGAEPTNFTNGDVDGISVATWLQDANNHYGSINPADFEIVTNIGPLAYTGQVQEFIVQTPEPSSLALLVTGMLALMLLVIRRGRA
ncbi:MAG: PEP-CTERM sorting domain-containing protein [Terriglobia bacterium]|jgi:hypothetical protein